jgi:hypothetical protein
MEDTMEDASSKPVTVRLLKTFRPRRWESGHPALFVPGESIGVRPEEAVALIRAGWAEPVDAPTLEAPK